MFHKKYFVFLTGKICLVQVLFTAFEGSFAVFLSGLHHEADTQVLTHSDDQ